ncbi:GAF domain-containing DNA-binding protein [Hymenobacter canadensis]|uniref:GAF domain-containing DNA-binding protein n=1 Tax=Hymenobacter canadensis TaxID=2999067 RepID=A0ABY7LP11_9BACT|nr:GAF domain-containing DNA-binding protein [Hymenobacter canadensis]WBA41606.1 GAF domain-containing DNA-binding protein [Hymenobacter canadensis]
MQKISPATVVAAKPKKGEPAPLASALWEANRIEALRSYYILDTPQEEAFNNLVRLAAYICGTPISLVSLIDSNRQWIKARTGPVEMGDTPRDVTFCQHAMLSEDVLEIRDPQSNPLFKHYPSVTGDASIRFYAGAPLTTPDGMPLGTICTIDTEPRTLTEQQRDALRILAKEVMSHLELRRARQQLELEQQKMEGLLRMANDNAQSMFVSSRNEIFVKQDHKLVRVHTDDIRYVEALGDYVNIYTSRERYTVYSTMKELEAKLPVREFARIHRKYIVCLDRITAIEGDAVQIDTGRSSDRAASPPLIPIGNSYKSVLLSRLNLI